MRRAIIGVSIILIVVAVSVTYFALQPPKTIQIMISGVVLNVELARTPAELQKGLSDRDSMPENYGMLFIFDTEGNWSFWMHGMRFHLDIIWFNSGKHIVFIEQNLQPCGTDLCPIYSPSANAMYVLEVNAGFVTTHRVALGDMFTFVTSTPALGVGLNI